MPRQSRPTRLFAALIGVTSIVGACAAAVSPSAASPAAAALPAGQRSSAIPATSPAAPQGEATGWFTPGAAPQRAAASRPVPKAAGDAPVGLHVDNTIETDQGDGLGESLPGGDSVRVYSLGAVSRLGPDGRPRWSRTTASLYQDWQLSWDRSGYISTPQVPVGTNPADPLLVATAGENQVADMHAWAEADLTGDGVADTVVAEPVGINLGLADCNCNWPFTIPGSDLHVGTFLTVLDGRDGRTLYSQLEPGVVTQVAVHGDTVVYADETGDPSQAGAPGAWGSHTSVVALRLTPSGSALTGSTLWSYDTGSQWGHVFGLTVLPDGSTAVAWSDTPVGLGSPRPPDGHVVLLDPAGKARWDQRTAGYPTFTGYDSTRRLIAVAEETDPHAAIGTTVLGLRPTDGHAVAQIGVAGTLPTAFTVGAAGWVVAGVVTTTDQIGNKGIDYTAGSVTMIDPTTQRIGWTSTLAQDPDRPPFPGAMVEAAGRVIVSSWNGNITPTPAEPVASRTDLQALDAATGAPGWHRPGALIDPETVALAGPASAPTISGMSLAETGIDYGAATGTAGRRSPQLGDLYASIGADVNGDGTPDIIAGGSSGGLDAFDGRTPTKLLWHTDIGDTVHQIVRAPGDKLVVAATSRVAVVDLGTGRVRRSIALPGQYAWNVAVGTLGRRTGIVVGTDRLAAYDLTSAHQLWTYQPDQPAYFSEPAIVAGTVVAEWQTPVAAGSDDPVASAAVGLDAGTGSPRWNAPNDPTVIDGAQLWHGVIGGPGIAGAGATGAAFTWHTAGGSGQVDVRDARTGRLDYSDIDDAVDYHQGYVLDPDLGLFAVGRQGTAAIGPDGVVDQSSADGTGAAISHTAGGAVYLSASSAISAFDAAALDSATQQAPLASRRDLHPRRRLDHRGRARHGVRDDARLVVVPDGEQRDGREPATGLGAGPAGPRGAVGVGYADEYACTATEGAPDRGARETALPDRETACGRRFQYPAGLRTGRARLRPGRTAAGGGGRTDGVHTGQDPVLPRADR